MFQLHTEFPQIKTYQFYILKKELEALSLSSHPLHITLCMNLILAIDTWL